MTSALHAATLGRRAKPRIDIDGILHPRSVAIFGASDDLSKFGGRITHFLSRHGFAGEIVPINRRRDEIAGRKAYPDIASAPTAPDVAILAVPSAQLLPTLTEAASAGVGCCVIISTGFAEAGEAGEAMQAEIVGIAATTGMRIIGPNCMGLIVPHHRMALCSSVVLNTDTLGDGSIGLISQSGALMVSIFDRAKTDGIGFRHCISLGNQSDLEICDFMEYMVADPETKAICLYVEGLLDGGRFRRAAAAARLAGKPVLLVKTGRTQAGVTAARSHTASLAGSYDAFAAVCREENVVLAQDPDDMVRAAHLLVTNPGPRSGQGGVAILSSSGGSAGIACDRVTESGMRLAELSAETRAKLGELLLPPQAGNPVDLGGRKLPESIEIAGDATRILFEDPDTAYGLAVLASMPFYATRARLIAEAAAASAKPTAIVFTPGAAADEARRVVRELGLFVFDRFEDAIRALMLVSAYDAGREAPPKPFERPEEILPSRRIADLGEGWQTESEMKRLLADYGVSVARERLVSTPEDAARAAAEIGFPIVLKAVSRDIVHKSDVGAVAVGLGDADAVAEAARTMAARLAKEAPDARLDGFSVQEMVRGEAEVIVGARLDLQFGPVMVVGLGGTAVEILRDVAIAPAPLAPERVRMMIEGLRTAPLFFGARGRPPLDVEALAEAVARMSWLAVDLGPRLVEMEVNPLIVGATGKAAVAVDARAKLGAG